MNEQALNKAQLAELLGVPESWVRHKVAAGLLPHHRIGRHVRFFLDDIEEIKRLTAVKPTAVREPVVAPRRTRRRRAA